MRRNLPGFPGVWPGGEQHVGIRSRLPVKLVKLERPLCMGYQPMLIPFWHIFWHLDELVPVDYCTIICRSALSGQSYVDKRARVAHLPGGSTRPTPLAV